jgi:CxxC-x17-CxxC domain-containing protein
VNNFRGNSRSGGSKFSGRSSGGNYNRGGGSNFGNRNSGRTEMHRAVCADCGSNCEVPFRPTGDKPVLCSSCFGNSSGAERRSSRPERNDRGGDNRYSSAPRDFDRSRSRNDREMFSAVCDNCNRDCEVPFRPSSNKPVFCSNCFEDMENEGKEPTRKSASSGGSNDRILAELVKLNEKIDRIFSEMEPKVIRQVKLMKDKKEETLEADVVEVAQKPTPAKAVAKKTAKKSVKKATTKKATTKKKVVAKKK